MPIKIGFFNSADDESRQSHHYRFDMREDCLDVVPPRHGTVAPRTWVGKVRTVCVRRIYAEAHAREQMNHSQQKSPEWHSITFRSCAPKSMKPKRQRLLAGTGRYRILYLINKTENWSRKANCGVSEIIQSERTPTEIASSPSIFRRLVRLLAVDVHMNLFMFIASPLTAQSTKPSPA